MSLWCGLSIHCPMGTPNREPHVLCPPAWTVHNWPTSTKVLVPALQRSLFGWVFSERPLGVDLSRGRLGDRMQTRGERARMQGEDVFLFGLQSSHSFRSPCTNGSHLLLRRCGVLLHPARVLATAIHPLGLLKDGPARLLVGHVYKEKAGLAVLAWSLGREATLFAESGRSCQQPVSGIRSFPGGGVRGGRSEAECGCRQWLSARDFAPVFSSRTKPPEFGREAGRGPACRPSSRPPRLWAATLRPPGAGPARPPPAGTGGRAAPRQAPHPLDPACRAPDAASGHAVAVAAWTEQRGEGNAGF